MSDTSRSFPHIEEALASDDFQQVMHATYGFLREHAPVYWSETLGQWLVTSHRLVEEVLLHPSAFSSFGTELRYIARLPKAIFAELMTLQDHFAQPGLIHSDGADHTRLRRAVSRSFSPQAVSERRPAIQEQVTRLLDQQDPSNGAFDVIESLAFPLPVVVIAGVLGVPDGDLARFPAWSELAIKPLRLSSAPVLG